MARLPPAEKLPLAVRKNIRDSWENKKADFEQKLSDLLGQPWTIDIDPLKIWPYGEDRSWAKESTGDLIAGYVTGAQSQLQSFLDKTGDDGKSEINNACTAHTLTMDFDEEKKFTYCGCQVSSSGQLVILFGEGYLGTNIDYALENDNLVKALNSASSSAEDPLSFSARESVRKDYNAEIGRTQEKLSAILQKTVTLEPNFEEVSSKLKAASDAPGSWEVNLGSFVRLYFEGLLGYLTREKFGEDDMLQEGLAEAVDKSIVQFRLVDELKASYNECVIEDGVLYLQTKPQYFGANVDDVANGLMELL